MLQRPSLDLHIKASQNSPESPICQILDCSPSPAPSALALEESHEPLQQLIQCQCEQWHCSLSFPSDPPPKGLLPVVRCKTMSLPQSMKCRALGGERLHSTSGLTNGYVGIGHASGVWRLAQHSRTGRLLAMVEMKMQRSMQAGKCRTAASYSSRYAALSLANFRLDS